MNGTVAKLRLYHFTRWRWIMKSRLIFRIAQFCLWRALLAGRNPPIPRIPSWFSSASAAYPLVAQVANLLCRGFPIRKRWEARKRCRLEVCATGAIRPEDVCKAQSLPHISPATEEHSCHCTSREAVCAVCWLVASFREARKTFFEFNRDGLWM